MNGYTSGTQALQGRTVNHDPRPYQVYADGVPSWRRNFHRERFGNGFGDVITDTYNPRPEFDVLDNPILAEFRSDWDGTYERICWWLAMLEENVYPSWTPEQLDHARRVLTKLAALNA